MKQRFLVASACMFAMLLAGCTYDYEEPRPPEESIATQEVRMAVENIDSTPNGFAVTKAFPAEGVCSYESTASLPTMIDEDYSALVAEYVKNESLPEIDLKKGILKPKLHHMQDAGVTVIVPDNLLEQILNTPSKSNGMIRVHKRVAESLVRNSLSDFEAFLRLVGADDSTAYYVAKSSCLNDPALPESSEPLPELQRCWFDLAIPAHSPDCPPSKLLDNGERHIDTLPESGPCSVEEASQTQALIVDFMQYIRAGGIAEPRWRMYGSVIVVPVEVFDRLRMMSPEIPDDNRQMYPISQGSYGSLKASMPSLAKAMYSWDSQGFLQSYYITSELCLTLTPPEQ